MGCSIRSYIRTRSGEITPIPYARFERLWKLDAREALPEYANDSLCVAIAYVYTEAGEPVELTGIDYLRLKLDAKGRLHPQAQQRMLRLALDSVDWRLPPLGPPQPPSVIEARHRFFGRQRDAECAWKPTPQQQQSIVRSALAPRGRGST